MADHKNQHYVPRSHLKPFSLNGAGAAINVFNIPRSRAIRNAPVKGQCAQSYIYGADLKLEEGLQVIEGHYARIVRIVENEETPSVSELNVLRKFALLQYMRTAMAMERMRQIHRGAHSAIYEGKPVRIPDLDVSDRRMMIASLHMFAKIHDAIDDLKVCIVKNETGIDFVTSDDPSVVVSKYMAQRERTNNFGLGSSGTLLFLPLTPRACLMFYDGGVYTVAGKRGYFLPIDDPDDALAINELQYLKAAQNIYFSRWDDRDRIAQEFGLASPRRPKSWSEFSVFIPAGVSGTMQDGGVLVRERFRRATDAERRTARQTLVAFGTKHPVPSRWISKLAYRDPPQIYGNGSAAGPMRKARWESMQRNRRAR